jgi:hypothetical protein
MVAITARNLSMDLLREGQFTNTSMMKDLLKQIFLMRSPGNSTLRITSEDGLLNGHIYIYDSTFVTGASLHGTKQGSDEVGYGALRKLLGASKGSFAFWEVAPGEPVDSDFSMNIGLRKVSEHIEDLPESPSALFDQSALLDKVFNPNGASNVASTPPPVTTALPAAPAEERSVLGRVLLVPEEGIKPAADWSAVQPFFGSMDGEDEDNLSAEATSPVQSVPPRYQRSELQPRGGQLRALSSKPVIEENRSKRHIYWGIALAAIIIVTIAAVLLIRKNPASEDSSVSVPTVETAGSAEENERVLNSSKASSLQGVESVKPAKTRGY